MERSPGRFATVVAYCYPPLNSFVIQGMLKKGGVHIKPQADGHGCLRQGSGAGGGHLTRLGARCTDGELNLGEKPQLTGTIQPEMLFSPL